MDFSYVHVVSESLGKTAVLQWVGMCAALLGTLAFLPYMRDTLLRRTSPQRASWLIWSVLSSIAFVSQVFEGASSSLWFAAGQVICTVLILVLSLRVGSGRFLSGKDYLIVALAIFGLVLWYFTDTAVYALAITISVSLLGGMATAIKAFRQPQSETLSTWVLSAIASVLAIVSVGELNWVLLAYPLYLLTLYTMFICAIVMGRRRCDVPKQLPVPKYGVVAKQKSAAQAVIVAKHFGSNRGLV